MAKRFVRSLNGGYKGMTDKSAYSEGSIIFNEKEDAISAFGKNYIGVSKDSVGLDLNLASNAAKVLLKTKDTISELEVTADTVTIKGSDVTGEKIIVTPDTLTKTITLKHELISTTVVPATGEPEALADGGTFQLYMPIEYTNGHVTKLEKKAYKLNIPASKSYGLKAANSVTDGLIVLTENGIDANTVKIDGGTNILVNSNGSGVLILHAAPTTDETKTYTAPAGTSDIADGTTLLTGLTVQKDAQGHITGITATTGKMPQGKADPGNGLLTIKANGQSKGTFSANQSTAVDIDITAADLGLTQAMKYIGKTTTSLSDGSTTSSIVIDSKTVYVEQGNVVIDANDAKEYIWNGAKWEEFGNEGNYKVIQTAVSDPTANGTTLDFIATISQDANGVITPTKKTVPTASTSLGVVKTTSTVTSTSGLTASPIIDGVVYYKDTDNNTAHAHSVGVGLAIDGTGGTSGTTTYKAKLKSETAHTASSATPTNAENRQYAVGVDKDGYLSVNVPWKNDNTTYSAGTGISISSDNKINHSNSITAGTAQGGSGTLAHGGTFTVPTVTYDAQGHITATGTTTYTLPGDNNTDTKVKNTAIASKVFILGQSAQGGDAAEAYTNASVYMQSGKLYSEGYEVINSDDWDWEEI